MFTVRIGLDTALTSCKKNRSQKVTKHLWKQYRVFNQQNDCVSPVKSYWGGGSDIFENSSTVFLIGTSTPKRKLSQPTLNNALKTHDNSTTKVGPFKLSGWVPPGQRMQHVPSFLEKGTAKINTNSWFHMSGPAHRYTLRITPLPIWTFRYAMPQTCCSRESRYFKRMLRQQAILSSNKTCWLKITGKYFREF